MDFSIHIKGLVNLKKTFFKTPIDQKARDERNRMPKAPSKIQSSYQVMKVSKFN